MTMLFVIGTFVGSISCLLAWARLEAQQVKCFGLTCGEEFASWVGPDEPLRGILHDQSRVGDSTVADYLRGEGQ